MKSDPKKKKPAAKKPAKKPVKKAPYSMGKETSSYKLPDPKRKMLLDVEGRDKILRGR